jgi:DNA-binding GntR family transcriptional regulator
LARMNAGRGGRSSDRSPRPAFSCVKTRRRPDILARRPRFRALANFFQIFLKRPLYKTGFLWYCFGIPLELRKGTIDQMTKKGDPSNSENAFGISKQEYIYNVIRKQIIENKYKPGSMLVERTIGAEFNISRTPIREAFRRLAQDGFVNVTSGKGVFVADISIENMLEIFELREALEKMAIKLLLLKENNDIIRQVEQCAEKQQDAYKNGDGKLFMQWDMEFHNLIAEGSGNGRLMNSIRGIYDQVQMLAISVEEDPVLLEMAGKQHAAILEAIKNRDVKKAEEAMMNHIVETKIYHLSKQLGYIPIPYNANSHLSEA